MIPGKAIEIGKQYRRDGEFHDLQDFQDFVDLGVEALEALLKARTPPFPAIDYYLPSETED